MITMRTNKLLLYVCILPFLLVIVNGCKKEKVEHPLPKWFLNRTWHLTSLKLNGVEVPDTINKYFNEYKFQFYDYCDPLNRCYYGCYYYNVEGVYHQEYSTRPSLPLFIDGIIEGYSFCYIYPGNYYPYPILSLEKLRITKIDKEEIHLITENPTTESYELLFKSSI